MTGAATGWTTERESAVRCHDLSFSYRDGTDAVADLGLDVAEGEIFCLLGQNGAGKTTLIRLITGDLKPKAGRIELAGLDIRTHADRARRRLGVLPQSAGLFAALSARQHLQTFAGLKGFRGKQAEEAVATVLALCPAIASFLDRRAGLLSLGQQRWVLVALTLLGLPPVLILDEPSVGMDPQARRALWSVLRSLRDRGTTIVLTTHYLDEAERLSDRVGFLSGGRIALCGTMPELHRAAGGGIRLEMFQTGEEEEPEVLLLGSIEAAQIHIDRCRPARFAVGRASLDDVYLRLIEEPIS